MLSPGSSFLHVITLHVCGAQTVQVLQLWLAVLYEWMQQCMVAYRQDT